MFTNWLTGTTGLTDATSLPTNRLQESHKNSTPPVHHSSGLSTLLTTNSLSNLNSNIMSSPPDIILEVGPAPTTVRFMAHGIVLGMHSGYLRSAIRLDERNGSGGVSNSADIIIYLTNVTPEQFAPLLTYMYTGYLDLNVENIFGVLLATHVLHMPRALEICRSYLARAQTEGYFGSNSNTLTTPGSHQALTTNGKIIRPIASKPQLPNFGFLPLTHPISLATNNIPNSTITSNQSETKPSNNVDECNKSEEDIEVDELDKQSVNNENRHLLSKDIDEDDEDVEVFIDSTSEAEVVVETEIQKLSFKKSLENKKSHERDRGRDTKSKHEKSHSKKSHHKSERRRKSSSGLQVAKAPIPASQLDTSEANKVIIDVASCDGPVRFKRILNTAYGHKPESCSANHSGLGGSGMVPQERSLQSVSLSFHQQMAKTISQQQQQLHQAEESENSETSNGSAGGGGDGRTASGKASGSRKIQSEIFVCVYCKHTFKSQYCYQKHAKRHLNPLTLQATCVPSEGKRDSTEESNAIPNGEIQITKHQNLSNQTRPFYIRNPTHFSTASAQQSTGATSSLQSTSTSSADYLRREVRPLDMNVQYYPCKTCGSKFPSYYFVHKHRKMCHADEEAQQTTDSNNATANATVTSAYPEEECLNSKNSD